MSTDTTGIPLPGARPRGRAMFSSLRNRGYRLFLISQSMSTMGVWTQRVAVDWTLMQLTGDITLVGSLVVLQFGPVLLLGMWGGVLVDRHSTKLLLLASQFVAFAVCAILAGTALAGVLAPWMLFACAAALGLSAVVDQPGRQVLIGQVVPAKELSNAISMNSIVFQIGGMIGPALSGALLAGPGAPAAFLLAAGVQLVALLSMAVLFARARMIPRERAPRVPGQIKDALRYAASKPEIHTTLALLVFVCVVGLNWPVILVSMMTSQFDSGAGGYGLANTALAAGSLVGALASLRRVHRGLRTVFLSVSIMCALRLLCGVMPTEWSFLLAVAATGAGLILMWTAANSLLQWSSNSGIRGRIMSLYLMIAVGGQALGGPLLGWGCATFGPRATLVASAAIPLIAAGILAVRQMRKQR
jgi:MFS family permease